MTGNNRLELDIGGVEGGDVTWAELDGEAPSFYYATVGTGLWKGTVSW